MSAQIINGTILAKKIKEEVQKELTLTCKMPKLVVIMAGDDYSSQTYVNMKASACKQVGFDSSVVRLPSSIKESELIDIISKLNVDDTITGILVQLPLPSHIDASKIAMSIHCAKDVDCLNPTNLGRIMLGKPIFFPCTPAGIVKLMIDSSIEISGKECVVIGRSNIVGKPLAIMLLSYNATVTICHSKTTDLKGICKRADILISAVGYPKLITTEYVKSGAVVIDVGISRTKDNKLIGDVDFDSVVAVASAITPVPKGIGPMTVAMLMHNTLTAYKLQNNGEYYDI